MRRIGLFYKLPVPGTVKTRLCPPLTSGEAAGLYEAMLQDAVAICRGVARTEIILFEAPEGSRPARGRPAWAAGLKRLEQTGADLGSRMDAAFDRLLSRPGDLAILLGSDAPTLPSSCVETAFEKLAQNDVVLGPASDGGYCLIGLTRRCPELFDGIGWSGASVFADTSRRAASLGLRLSCTDPWYDVDTPVDLDHLVRELRDNPTVKNAAPATRLALTRLGRLTAC